MTIPLIGERALPHALATSVTAIPPHILDGQHVMLDWDATTAPHFTGEAAPEVIAWLQRLSIPSLSVSTFNPLLLEMPGLEPWQPAVYKTRRIIHPDTGHRKWTSKLHVSFFLDAAEQENLPPSRMTLIDNTYMLGAAAAARAGYQVILVEPIRRHALPEWMRLLYATDRKRFRQVQRMSGKLTADETLVFQKAA